MSVSCLVFLQDDKLPTIAQWQAALDRVNVGIVLEHVDDLRTHVGFIPATYGGHPSGFEWFYGPVSDNYGGDPPEGLGNLSHVADLVTHSDMREAVCSSLAGTVLTQLADGLSLDEDSGEVVNGDAALKVAREYELHLR